MLLDAPGIRPTALCLFRQGDVDWLCLYEMHKVLPIYIPRGFINKGIPTGKSLHLNLSALSSTSMLLSRYSPLSLWPVNVEDQVLSLIPCLSEYSSCVPGF